MKHFLANSNENERTRNSSDFDDRLFREYYGYAFYKGITEGGSRAYMAAYNKYNGIPCTVHPVLKSVTVEEWGQNGIIATDGGAYRQLLTEHGYFPDLETAAAGCIHAGITMFLDNYQQPLQNAISKGMVTQEEIDRAVRGNLRVLLKLGLLDDSAENPYSTIGITDTVDIWDKPETHQLARKATVKSVVLMKNENQLLPLDQKKIRTLAVIGPSANKVISDWYAGTPPYQVTALEGIRNAVGEDVEVLFAQSNKADSAVIAASKADVAIVCVGNHPLCNGLGWAESYVYSNGKEAIDREAISLEQEDLVKVVKAANPHTVMVVVSSFPYSINWSKEQVPVILHIAQSSQELGNGLADILFGKESPAGRLVQTWSASMDHLPPILDYNIRHGRTYMYDPHEPLFPFGHGLTYTTFDYAGLEIQKPVIRENEKTNLTVTLKNTGDYDSDEVVQVYASFPDSKVERPGKALKGFKRVFVPKGQTVKVTVPIDSEDLKYWDVEKQAFALEKGKVKFFVGPSSANLPLITETEVK
jgi:beta-glucosidase